MKKSEFNEFADFVMDEATKYGRTITKPEIETYFENFPSASLRDFKAAWVEHKRDPKHGRFFPKITDLQRALRTGNEGEGKHDHRCIWNGNGERCKYPVGWFDLGKTEGFCKFHRAIPDGPAAQVICDESQTATREEYLARAKAHTYGNGGDNPNIAKLRAQLVKRSDGAAVGILTSRLAARLTKTEAPEADQHVAAADAARLAAANEALALAAQGDE